jgi:hypothetical protein
MIATVVDWSKILEVVRDAAVAGVGVCLIFALAVFGATRSLDLRRSQRLRPAAALAGLGLLGFAASLAAIVYGVVLITAK